MAVRLIALDIDGTLLDSDWQLPDANREAVRQAVLRGVEVVLVTGRRYEFALPVARLFDVELTLIVNNGALVKTAGGTTLMSCLLPVAVARRVLEATLDFRDSASVVFDRPMANQLIYERIDWETPVRRAYVEMNRPYVAEVQPLEDCLTEDPVQLSFNGSVSSMRSLVRVVAALPCADCFTLAVTEYESRDFTLVDVVGAECSKGAMLARWAERRNIGRDEVMAIGDNLNDFEMLDYAGIPVVMGNAVPALRQNGWHVTGTSDEAGVASAIERFVLGADEGL